MSTQEIENTLNQMKEFLRTDKHNLDEELVQQPELYNKVSELYVEAVARRDYLKEQISRVDATLYSKHKRAIEKKGVRATEVAVSSAVNDDKKHRKIVDQHLKAKELADKALALKESFHQRRYMIQELCGLYNSNYYTRNALKESTDVKDYTAQRNIEEMNKKRSKLRRGKKDE